MLNHLPYLPEGLCKPLAQLVTGIVSTISPEKIICYGWRTTFMRDWGCFIETDGYRETVYPTYDFLVVTNADEKKADHEIIQLCEQQAEPLKLRVTCVIHKLASVNDAIEKGSRFFTTLHNKGALLYNSNRVPLADPPGDLPIGEIKNRVEETWKKGFDIANRFYHLGKQCLGNEWYELSVFMLHQSMQHGCMVLLKAIIGYRSNTHNLARLLALIDNFSMLPSSIFPLITKEETELLNLLRNAYSDARYKEDYTVPSEKAAVLSDRVKQLLSVAERLYEEKLTSLNPEPVISFPITINNVKEENK